MTRKRQIKLGAMLYGVGTGYDDWRHPDAVLDACVNIGFYRRQAALAESGKFDFVFFTDHVHITPASTWHYLNRFEALTVLSAIAGATSRIGLVASVSLAYSEPFTTARQLASLDGISGGRAGWNAVTSWTKGSEGNFRKPPGLTEESRFRYAKEYLEVIKGLWDSWEDGAFVRDKQSGVYFDPGKLHELNHRGEFFAVKGPLNIARSRQGHPVLFQVGTGEDIREFAAEHADVLFVGHDDLEEARAFYREMKKRAASYGRDPGELIILQGIGPIVGKNSEEAERLYSEKLALLSLDNALASLSRAFNGFDFSRYPLDGPFPALDVQSSALAGIQQSSRTLVRTAKERGGRCGKRPYTRYDPIRNSSERLAKSPIACRSGWTGKRSTDLWSVRRFRTVWSVSFRMSFRSCSKEGFTARIIGRTRCADISVFPYRLTVIAGTKRAGRRCDENMKIKLSVLDQSPILPGQTHKEAIADTVNLAIAADKLGFHRYWVAEHHNSPISAGTSPEVLIARLGSVTSRIRIGSGGVALINYSPLHVAENFRMLEALYPGRIDLGLVRAPYGRTTNSATTRALDDGVTRSIDRYDGQIGTLLDFLDDRADGAYAGVRALPVTETRPDVWVLGSSAVSAQSAAKWGTAFSFAHFISPEGAREALTVYRSGFRPSVSLAEARASIGVLAVCAETDTEAERLARETERHYTLPPAQEGQPSAAVSTADLRTRERMIYGTPIELKRKLSDLASLHEVDELLILTVTERYETRLRSYELIAEAFDLTQQQNGGEERS